MTFEFNSKYNIGQTLYRSVKEGLLKVSVVGIYLKYDTASNVARFSYNLKVMNPSMIIGGVLFPALFKEEEHEMEGRYLTSKEELVRFLVDSVD